jgi:hypothetical protein
MTNFSAYLAYPVAVDVARAVLWLLLGVSFSCWLKGTLTPERFLSIFESEGVLSIRLILAAIVVIFTLCMQAADRLAVALVEANYFLAGTLLGLGTAKVVGKAFARRPPDPPAQIENKVKVGDNATFQTPPPGPEQ